MSCVTRLQGSLETSGRPCREVDEDGTGELARDEYVACYNRAVEDTTGLVRKSAAIAVIKSWQIASRLLPGLCSAI